MLKEIAAVGSMREQQLIHFALAFLHAPRPSGSGALQCAAFSWFAKRTAILRLESD
jgi:hypothetical protein